MKKLITYTVIALFVTATISFAKTPDKEAIMKKETAAWQAFKDKNADDFKKLVDKDFRGVYEDGWTAGEIVAVLKRPDRPAALRVTLTIPEAAAAGHIELYVDGERVLENTFDGPGSYTVSTGILTPRASESTVMLKLDKTVRVPPDARDLGVLLTEIGFTK